VNRRTVALAGALLVGLLAGVVAHLPAARVLAWIDPAGIDAAGVSGSVWSGRAQRVDFGGPAPASDVRWDMAAWRLLTAQASGTAELELAGARIDGVFAVSPGGRLRVTDTRIEGPANALVTLAEVPALAVDGQLIARIESAAWTGQKLAGATGQFQWNDARLIAPLQLALGQVSGRLSPQGEGRHRLTLDNRGGQVSLEGTIDLSADGRYTVDLTMQPAPDAPAEVADTLNQFLPRRGDRFVIEDQGQL